MLLGPKLVRRKGGSLELAHQLQLELICGRVAMFGDIVSSAQVVMLVCCAWIMLFVLEQADHCFPLHFLHRNLLPSCYTGSYASIIYTASQPHSVYRKHNMWECVYCVHCDHTVSFMNRFLIPSNDGHDVRFMKRALSQFWKHYEPIVLSVCTASAAVPLVFFFYIQAGKVCYFSTGLVSKSVPPFVFKSWLNACVYFV